MLRIHEISIFSQESAVVMQLQLKDGYNEVTLRDPETFIFTPTMARIVAQSCPDVIVSRYETLRFQARANKAAEFLVTMAESMVIREDLRAHALRAEIYGNFEIDP